MEIAGRKSVILRISGPVHGALDRSRQGIARKKCPFRRKRNGTWRHFPYFGMILPRIRKLTHSLSNDLHRRFIWQTRRGSYSQWVRIRRGTPPRPPSKTRLVAQQTSTRCPDVPLCITLFCRPRLNKNNSGSRVFSGPGRLLQNFTTGLGQVFSLEAGGSPRYCTDFQSSLAQAGSV
jgi:hypothetical protein